MLLLARQRGIVEDCSTDALEADHLVVDEHEDHAEFAGIRDIHGLDSSFRVSAHVVDDADLSADHLDAPVSTRHLLCRVVINVEALISIEEVRQLLNAKRWRSQQRPEHAASE